MNVPAYPQYDPSNTLSLAAVGGPVGIAFSGVQIYSPYGGWWMVDDSCWMTNEPPNDVMYFAR